MAFRQLKQQVLHLLQAEDFSQSLAALARLPARQVVNPLFSLLYHGEERIRWRAVSAMGAVVSQLADREMESARVIMRRLMWNLNDESGGIGWGSPEAMGEIMALHQRLAGEYARILVSYLDPQGNFIEHERLQEGVLWAVGRVGRIRPELVRSALPFLDAFLTGSNPALRGLALWAAVPFAADLGRRGQVEKMSYDDTPLGIYTDNAFIQYTVADLARRLLSHADKQKSAP